MNKQELQELLKSESFLMEFIYGKIIADAKLGSSYSYFPDGLGKKQIEILVDKGYIVTDPTHGGGTRVDWED